ncbi:hypothetical protein LTR02_018195, partial [Friedmanniomyces endolithicus]
MSADLETELEVRGLCARQFSTTQVVTVTKALSDENVCIDDTPATEPGGRWHLARD